ncbi:MAG: T9SS type A sorting domain-containing protein [Bacteroidota bacterium]
MKKIYSLLFILFAFQSLSGQIQPYMGIYPVDSLTFENSPQFLSIQKEASSIWQIGSSDKIFFGTGFSAPNAIMTDTINPYPDNNHSYFDLIIPTNQFLSVAPVINFRHKLQCDTITEGGYIEISYDKGLTWKNVVFDSSCITNISCFGNCPPNTENMYSATDTISGGIPAFTGTINNWKYSRLQWIYDLPIKLWPMDTTLLRFHFISDGNSTGKAGWIIDNISLDYTNLGSEISGEESISLGIYPNPASDLITIEITQPNDFTEIILQDVLSRNKRYFSIINNQIQQISVGDLPRGTYVCSLISKDGRTYNRIIVLK